MSLEMTRRAFLGFVAAVPALAKAATFEGWATPKELEEAAQFVEPPSVGGENTFWINKRKIEGLKNLQLTQHSTEPVFYNHGTLVSPPRASHVTIEAEWFIDEKSWPMANYSRELIRAGERVEVDYQTGRHVYSCEAKITNHELVMEYMDYTTLRLEFMAAGAVTMTEAQTP